MSELQVGIVGYGRVGAYLARSLREGAVHGAELFGVNSSSRGQGKAQAALDGVDWYELDDLVVGADLVVEVATAAALPTILNATLAAQKPTLMVSSAGLLLDDELLELAQNEIAEGSGTPLGLLHFVSCPLPGLDLVRVAARSSTITELRVISSFNPRALIGAEFATSRNYLASIGIDVDTPPETREHFVTCSAREGGLNFPQQFNTPVTFALAGPGVDNTIVEVWADPDAESSYHRVQFRSGLIDFDADVVIHPELPSRKSLIVGPNVLAAIARHVSRVWVGS